MTTIITRVFPDKDAATYAAERLVFRGLPSRALSVITDSDDAAARMEAAKVDESAIKPYAEALKSGRAVLAVRATYKPLMAATIVRDTLAKFETVDVGAVTDEYFVPDGPQKAESVLKEHPLFLTVRPARSGYDGGPVTKGLGFNLLSTRKPRARAMKGGGFMSRSFWPMALLSKKPRSGSVIPGGRHMSRLFWPMPLLSKRTRTSSVIHGGDLPLSRALGWPPVS